MSRNLILSHLLPAAASSAVAGLVNYGILQHSFRGVGIGALAGLVYSATHDILKAKKSESSLFNHSAAILASAILTYGISAAAAAAGLIAMPTLAGIAALITTAIIVDSVTRLIFMPRKPEAEVAKPPRVTPRRQVPAPVKQIEQPQVNQPEVSPVPNPAPAQAAPDVPQPAAAPLLPPEPPKALTPEPPKPAPENPPAPPSQPAPQPAPIAAPPLVPTPPTADQQTVDQFLASSDFKNCTAWLEDFANIDTSKWFHKSADKGRYVTTGGNASIIPGAQTFASLVNKHTNEKLAQDLQASTKIFADILPKIVTTHNSCQDKTSIHKEIEKINKDIKSALKKLPLLKKTYKSDSKVQEEITNLMNTLRHNQLPLLTKISSK